VKTGELKPLLKFPEDPHFVQVQAGLQFTGMLDSRSKRQDMTFAPKYGDMV
jgi:hypothetical protein